MASIQVFSEHAEICAKAFQSSYSEFQNYTDAEKLIWFGAIYGFFKHFEQIYAQYRNGLIREEEWESWNEHIRMQFHQSGVRWWWDLRRTSFAKPFREYLDSSTPPEMKTMTAVFQDRPNRIEDGD